jgi:hypothetical protein
MKGRLNDTFKDELTATAMKLGTAAFLLTIREAGFKPTFWNLQRWLPRNSDRTSYGTRKKRPTL